MAAGLCHVQRPAPHARLRQLDRLAHRVRAAPTRRAHRAADQPRPRTRHRAGRSSSSSANSGAALREYCAAKDVRILGDVAIFVNYDSADVWTHPELLRTGRAAAGPSASPVCRPTTSPLTGQRWGNPLYKWGLLRERGFDWWVARIRRSLALYDMIRLDHFRGFEAYWSIPAEEETAVHGQWVKAPGHELFQRLREVFGTLPFVAEDLGLITPEVDELREHFGMPGMRILQFGFSDRGSAPLSAAQLRPQHRRLHRHSRQQHHPRLVARRHQRSGPHQRPDLPPAHSARR